MRSARPTVTDRAESGTVTAALAFAEARLHRGLHVAIEEPGEIRSEARALVRLAAGLNDSVLYARPDAELSAPTWRRLRTIVGRRSAGEPLAYIEGSRGFHALELTVDPNVLIPRPETELIVETVLERASSAVFQAADLGTGSGAIALALAYACPQAQVVGIDVCANALTVARANGHRLGLEIEWIESDWFSRSGDRRFDFVCCNPPYIRSNDPHFEHLQYEPRIALDGGGDGLQAIRRVLGDCAAHLNTHGIVLLEHGFDQSAAVARIGAAAGLRRCEVLRDFGGHERVSIFCLAEQQ